MAAVLVKANTISCQFHSSSLSPALASLQPRNQSDPPGAWMRAGSPLLMIAYGSPFYLSKTQSSCNSLYKQCSLIPLIYRPAYFSPGLQNSSHVVCAMFLGYTRHASTFRPLQLPFSLPSLNTLPPKYPHIPGLSSPSSPHSGTFSVSFTFYSQSVVKYSS